MHMSMIKSKMHVYVKKTILYCPHTIFQHTYQPFLLFSFCFYLVHVSFQQRNQDKHADTCTMHDYLITFMFA